MKQNEENVLMTFLAMDGTVSATFQIWGGKI
jgi:hypothetical protein